MDSVYGGNVLHHLFKPVRDVLRRRDKRRRQRSGVDCVSFPKSGRTWLKFMLDRLGLPVRFTHAGQMRDRPPLGNYDPTPHYAPDRHIVFLHRDPRDTAVSMFFEVSKRIEIYDGTLKECLRDPRYGIEAVIEYNESWLDLLADKPNALIVTYEDLHEAPRESLRRIVDHIAPGSAPDDAQIDAAIEAGTFGNMRKAEGGFLTWLAYGRAMQPRDESDRESFKVRRGKVGGFVDYFAADDVEFADKVLAQSRHYRHLAGTAAAGRAAQ